MIPFQAVVVRYVHDVSVDEFLNVGLVLFAPNARFVEATWLETWTRITHAFPGAKPALLRRVTRAIDDTLARWVAEQNELALTPVTNLSSLLGRALAGDDASIAFSSPISGVTSDPRRSLHEFFELYVGKQLRSDLKRPTRDDREVWSQFAAQLETSVLSRLESRVVTGAHLQVEFEQAWKNGVWNLLKPLSFDLNDCDAIEDKATTWVGRVTALRPQLEDNQVVFLVGMPGPTASPEVKTAARDGAALLRETLARSAQVVDEDDQRELARKIASDLNHEQA
jgi:hypothetical protein